MKALYEHLTEQAAACANHHNPKPFGAVVHSRHFSGGFGFRTVTEAAEWVDRLAASAIKDDTRNDFRAAIATAAGQSLSLYS